MEPFYPGYVVWMGGDHLPEGFADITKATEAARLLAVNFPHRRVWVMAPHGHFIVPADPMWNPEKAPSGLMGVYPPAPGTVLLRATPFGGAR